MLEDNVPWNDVERFPGIGLSRIFFVLRVFIYNDQLLRGSLSIKGEVERREELVGMFTMSLSASRRGSSMSMDSEPAPVSAALQIGTERCRRFNLVCRGRRGEKGSEGF